MCKSCRSQIHTSNVTLLFWGVVVATTTTAAITATMMTTTRTQNMSCQFTEWTVHRAHPHDANESKPARPVQQIHNPIPDSVHD